MVNLDSFSKFVWTVPLKKKKAQTIKHSFENILISSKRKPNLFGTDRGKEFYSSIFQIFLNNNNNEQYFKKIHLGSVFAKTFNRTFRDLLKTPVFEKGESNWVDFLHTRTKQNNNRVYTSIELAPIQNSFKKNKGFVCKKILDEGNKIKPNFLITDLVGTAELRSSFSKCDAINWSYIMYKITEFIHDTLLSYRIDNLSEQYNETLLKKTEFL